MCLVLIFFFFLVIRRPPRSTLFPTRRSSDLEVADDAPGAVRKGVQVVPALLDGGAAVELVAVEVGVGPFQLEDRKSTRLNSSHSQISYAVFCLKKKKNKKIKLPLLQEIYTIS